MDSGFPRDSSRAGKRDLELGFLSRRGDPRSIAYATRVSTIFAAARSSHFYDPLKFDLIMDGCRPCPGIPSRRSRSTPR